MNSQLWEKSPAGARIVTILVFIVGFCLAPAQSVQALELNAFGDITLSDSNQPGTNSGFSLGQLDFWATQNLDEEGRFRTFLELVVESPGEGFVIDLERLWIQYAATPDWDLRAGRMHTALGYWNRNQHHGAHMQTTVSRPLFLDFEDGETAVLPTHTVGIMSQVEVDTALSGITLTLQGGNGAHYNGAELDPNNVGDNDNSKALALRIALRPLQIEYLEFGLGLNRNRLEKHEINNDVNGDGQADASPTETKSPWVDQEIWVADLSYVDRFATGIEFISEYYNMKNQDPTGKTYTTQFWYIQVAKTFRAFLTPYARYESFEDIAKGDPYFMTLGSTEYRLFLAGLRLDFNLSKAGQSALKFEVRAKDEAIGSSESYALQWTFGF